MKRVDLLLQLYSVGRLIKAKSKMQNHDIALTLLILNTLKDNPVDISVLANKIYSKLSSVSELVDELKQNDLIQTEESSDDKRKQILSLTNKGITFLNESSKKMEIHCTEIFNGMTVQEIDNLITNLKKIGNEKKDL